MHFGILKTTEETQRLVISPLVATRVGTDSVGPEICTFHLGFSLDVYRIREEVNPGIN